MWQRELRRYRNDSMHYKYVGQGNLPFFFFPSGGALPNPAPLPAPPRGPPGTCPGAALGVTCGSPRPCPPRPPRAPSAARPLPQPALPAPTCQRQDLGLVEQQALPPLAGALVVLLRRLLGVAVHRVDLLVVEVELGRGAEVLHAGDGQRVADVVLQEPHKGVHGAAAGGAAAPVPHSPLCYCSSKSASALGWARLAAPPAGQPQRRADTSNPARSDASRAEGWAGEGRAAGGGTAGAALPPRLRGCPGPLSAGREALPFCLPGSCAPKSSRCRARPEAGLFLLCGGTQGRGSTLSSGGEESRWVTGRRHRRTAPIGSIAAHSEHALLCEGLQCDAAALWGLELSMGHQWYRPVSAAGRTQRFPAIPHVKMFYARVWKQSWEAMPFIIAQIPKLLETTLILSVDVLSFLYRNNNNAPAPVSYFFPRCPVLRSALPN